MAVEIAWCWVQYQPQSVLSQWFLKRFGHGPRLRKIGIVALARKLLVALWKYLERGEVPPGPMLVIGPATSDLAARVEVALQRRAAQVAADSDAVGEFCEF